MYVRKSEANVIKISEILFSGHHFNGDQKIFDDDVIMAMVIKMTIQITLMIEIVMRKMMMITMILIIIMMMKMIMMPIMTG